MVTVVRDGELYHHGILGQRWGVRRTPEQLGHGPSGNSSKGNSSKVEASRNARRGLSPIGRKKTKARTLMDEMDSMSDQELRQRINRLQMEQQLSQLDRQQREASMGLFEPSAIDRELIRQELEEVYNNKTGKMEFMPSDEAIRRSKAYRERRKSK